MAESMTGYLRQFIEANAAARAATQKRLDEAMAIYEQNIQSYAPGGAYERGVTGQIDTARTKNLASSTQALVDSGLYNTSLRAGIGRKFEKDVATPAMLQMEDVQLQRLSAANL